MHKTHILDSCPLLPKFLDPQCLAFRLWQGIATNLLQFNFHATVEYSVY